MRRTRPNTLRLPSGAVAPPAKDGCGGGRKDLAVPSVCFLCLAYSIELDSGFEGVDERVNQSRDRARHQNLAMTR